MAEKRPANLRNGAAFSRSTLTRRDFLLAGVAAAFLPARAGGADSASVIIVGAGAAGLAAADALERRGVATCVIEARQRIGGRVWTTSDGIDMGASWIHGVRGNPVTVLARDAGVRTAAFNYEDILRFAGEGTPLSEDECKRVDSLFERFLQRVTKLRDSATPASALEPAVAAFQSHLDGVDRDLFRYAVRTGITHEYAADPERLSLEWFDAAEMYPGGDAVFPGGYAGIFRALRSPARLLTGETVRTIDWSGNAVRVVTDKGEHRAKAVIVTLPLGVLKKGSVRFEPALPSAKMGAITRLGVGTLNKVVLIFPKVAWPERTALFGRISDGSGEWEEWVNLHPINGLPALMGFNAGACAGRLERLTDAELTASALRALGSMFGASFPSPVRVHVSRWAADPFACGSYSHFAPGSSPEDAKQLVASVGERLFFAGEACSDKHPATVQGTILTGRAAASEVLAVL